MARNTQGSDAVTFQSFVNEVLEEKDRAIISDMINEFDKKNFEPLYYISRIAILSQHKKDRAAFERHTTMIIRQVEKDHAE
jgi:hypothetical protein